MERVERRESRCNKCSLTVRGIHTPLSFQSGNSSCKARGSNTAPDSVCAPVKGEISIGACPAPCDPVLHPVSLPCTLCPFLAPCVPVLHPVSLPLTDFRCLLYHTHSQILPTLLCQLSQPNGSRETSRPTPNYHHVTLITITAHVNICMGRWRVLE